MTKDERAGLLLELVACLTRLHQGELRERALGAGLQPVHLASLAYLRDANRYSNTPQALADFLGSTKGTVSQSLLLLYRKGLVERHADEHDGRVLRLKLSRRGLALSQAAHPEAAWQAAVAGIEPGELDTAISVLTRVLSGLQAQRGRRTFGVCRTCANFRREREGYRCALTGEALSESDSIRICREHTPAVD